MQLVHNHDLMRVDWLEDIVALLDAGGMADAARERRVSQPSFSRRIKVLEEVLGIDLVDRSVKPSGPSALVRHHERELRKIAAELRQLLTEMRQEQASGARQIVIACQHAISTTLGAEIVGLLAEPSRVHIRLRSANLDECETLLVTRQAAISLTYRLHGRGVADEEPPGFLAEAVIGRERLLPVCDARTPEAHRTRLRDGELRMIGYPPDVFLGAALSRHVLPALAARCRINVVTETGLTTAALQLAQSGLGVAWVPAALAQPALARGDLVELGEDLGALDMELVARRWRSTANRAAMQAWDKLTAARLGPEAP